MLNPDTEKANHVVSALFKNDGYCPCKLDKNEYTRCPCLEFRSSSKSGPCHCGLYIKAGEPNESVL